MTQPRPDEPARGDTQPDLEPTVQMGPSPAPGLDDPTLQLGSRSDATDGPTLASDLTPPGTGTGRARLPSSKLRGSSAGGLLRSTRREGEAPPGGAPTEGTVYAGKYELLHEIARGGMGVVYKARQIDLNRVVALKVMLAGSMAGEEDRRRFILEAEASARLKHPNIVPVYDIGEVGGNLYFTMDYVEGEPLSKRKASLTRDQLLLVMTRAVDAVAYAHQRGIIHRDLKPANIMMTADDEPLIMDFGLAKQVEVVDADGQPSLATREGAVMGTPHYMPPEQADGRVSEIDVRSDVYALGVILYELWTGELPFTARSLTELLLKIYEQDPRPPRQIDPSIDWDMEAIILKSLEKSKDRRYQSAQELKTDLERIREGLPVTARRATVGYRLSKWSRRNRKGLATATALLLMAGVTSGVLYRQRREQARRDQASYESRLADAREQVKLRAQEVAALSVRLADFLASGDVPARVAGLDPALKDVDLLVRHLGDARALVQPDARERPEAADLLREQLAPLEAQLGGLRARLTRLQDVQAEVARAKDELSTAADQARAAERALGEAGATGGDAGHDWPDLQAALQDPSPEATPDASGTPDDAGAAAWAAFDATARRTRQHLYAALSLCGEDRWPEARLAQERLEEVNALQRQVEGARVQAGQLRLAAVLHTRGVHLLRLLEAPGAGTRGSEEQTRRLRAARLAQALLARGREARADYPGLREAGLRANAAYARALLEMKAYLVFEAELSAADAFEPEARQALLDEAARAQRATKTLQAELEGMAAKLSEAPDAAALGTLVARLEALANDPALDVPLDATRRDLLGRARATLQAQRREAAYREVDQAVAAAQRLEADAGADPAAVLAERQAAWEEAARRLRAQRDLLGEVAVASGLRRAAQAQARLAHDAALALERRDPARALQLAQDAATRYQPLAGDDAQVRAQLELVRDLVARLARVQAKPQGMVLFAGREAVELGSGPQDRNEPRRVKIAPFYLAQREVTNGEYAEFIGSRDYRDPAFWEALGGRLQDVARWPLGWTGPRPPAGQEDLPVTGVSWLEARGYARSVGMRLPTDAEWEYAARYQGGEPRPFPWGDAYGQGLLASAPRPPGSNPADVTAQGLLDMGGNVSEWVVLEQRRAGQAPELRPAARGASFLYPSERIARGVHRLLPRADYRGPQLGLRLAKGAE